MLYQLPIILVEPTNNAVFSDFCLRYTSNHFVINMLNEAKIADKSFFSVGDSDLRLITCSLYYYTSHVEGKPLSVEFVSGKASA